MDPLQQLRTQMQNMQMQITGLNTTMNYHKHTNADSTQLIPPIFNRVSLQDQANINTSCNLSSHFYVTLGGNRTLNAPIGMQGGQRVIWEFIQDSTGSRTITLNSVFKAGGFTITLTTTANKRDFMEAVYSAVDAKWYIINFVKNY